MEYILEGLRRGVILLFPPQKEVIEIVLLSLIVSGSATIVAGFVAIPLAACITLKEFKHKRVIVGFINTLLAIPAVVIGLLVYILVSRRGPLGIFGLLYSPYAMIIAQSVLAVPIVTAITVSALKNIAKDTRDVAYSLGADRWQMLVLLLHEGRFAVLTAVITGFSRVIGETGMTFMVGGNIKGATRVLTTAIALETMKGNFELGIALGVVLILIAVIINIFLQILQGR